jgi:hypothetical protein
VFTLLILATAGAAPNLAAPGLTCTSVSPGVCDAYLEHFVANVSSRGVSVVTKNDVAQVLSVERQKELLGCNDEKSASCLAELAGALGVGSVFGGTVAKVESGYVSTLKVINASDGSTKWSATTRVDDERALFRFLEEQAQRLVDVLIPPPPPIPFTRFVPGIAGGVLLAAGVGLRIAAGLEADTLRAHIKEPPQLTANEIVEIGRRGNSLQLFSALAMGVGVAGIATSVVWILVGGPPTASASVTPVAGGAVGTFEMEFP